MDIYFQEPDAVPLPPGEVRIRALHAEPAPDGQRVRIDIELDPFQRRPSLELTVLDPGGQEAVTASIIESMGRQLGLTLHLRNRHQAGLYTVKAVLFYSERPRTPEGEEPPSPKLVVVDRKEITFEIQA